MKKSANKRSEHLKKISWEHHQALRYALHIKKGLTNGTSGIKLVAYVKAVLDQHLAPHFAEEEQAVFSRLDAQQKKNAVLRQVLEEHRALPELALEIFRERGGDRERLLKFAEMIVNHVKLEEKELFPYIEQVLPEQELQAAQKQIAHIHRSDELDWSDEFWKDPAAA